MEIPSIKEELERKVVEILELAVLKAETHRLEKQDLALIGRTLWAATAGLVDQDISTFCEQAGNTMKPRYMGSKWVGNGKVVCVSWSPEEDGFHVETTDAILLSTGSAFVRADATTERAERLDALFAKLQTAGYIEI